MKPPAIVHDHVQVGVGGKIFLVVEIEHGIRAEHADRNRGDMAMNRVALELAGIEQLVNGIDQRHVGAGDRGGAGAAIGLDHIAVERDGALAQGFEVDHGPQAAADQALDLQGSTALLAAGRFAHVAAAGGARQHAVLGRHPARALAAQPGWHALFDAGVHSTRVSPQEINTEPSACLVK
jgi:hypothetical protein